MPRPGAAAALPSWSCAAAAAAVPSAPSTALAETPRSSTCHFSSLATCTSPYLWPLAASLQAPAAAAARRLCGSSAARPAPAASFLPWLAVAAALATRLAETRGLQAALALQAGRTGRIPAAPARAAAAARRRGQARPACARATTWRAWSSRRLAAAPMGAPEGAWAPPLSFLAAAAGAPAALVGAGTILMAAAAAAATGAAAAARKATPAGQAAAAAALPS